MKRIGNLYSKIIDFENLRQAEANARKGKTEQYGVKVFDRNPEGHLLLIQESLLNKTFRNSKYTTITIKEPKERLVFKLPYYPDRIIQHAIINVLKPYFHSWFTADTYANIEGKGIDAAVNGIKTTLKDISGTQFYLQIDIKKYYPNIDHDVLKSLIQKKIKDQDLFWLLNEIIDSAEGLPIGNYLSQYLANFYLSYFDHWLKEVKGVKYYFRYADDILILGTNKNDLHNLRKEIQVYFKDSLKLEMKGNHRVWPTKEGINSLGYIFYHSHTRLRKRIKQRFAKAVSKKQPKKATIAAYKGWAKRANTRHLIKKLLPNEKL